MTDEPIREIDLLAYADDRLDESRRTAVEAYLRAHPKQAARIADHRRHIALIRDLYAPVLAEPVPERLARAASPAVSPWPRQALRAAAVLALCVSTGVAGWWIGGGPGGPPVVESMVRASDETPNGGGVTLAAARPGLVDTLLAADRPVGELRLAVPPLDTLGAILEEVEPLRHEDGTSILRAGYRSADGGRFTLLIALRPSETAPTVRSRTVDSRTVPYWEAGGATFALLDPDGLVDPLAVARLAELRLVERASDPGPTTALANGPAPRDAGETGGSVPSSPLLQPVDLVEETVGDPL